MYNSPGYYSRIYDNLHLSYVCSIYFVYKLRANQPSDFIYSYQNIRVNLYKNRSKPNANGSYTRSVHGIKFGISSTYKIQLKLGGLPRVNLFSAAPSIGDALCHDRRATSVCSLLEIILDQIAPNLEYTLPGQNNYYFES